MKNPNSGHRERLKERFRECGLEKFEEHNILELLLFYAIPRRDTNKTAHALIEWFGSIANVFDASFNDLCEIDGISEHSATLIKMIPQLSAAYRISRSTEDVSLTDLETVRRHLSNYFIPAQSERVVCLIFDAAGAFIATRELGDGNAVASEVSPRKIAEYVLAARGSSVIISHFHPTCRVVPSVADIRATGTLRRILAGIDIDLVEHIIVARNGETLPVIEHIQSDPELLRVFYNRDR